METSGDILDEIDSEFREEYEATRRIMSYPEFLDVFVEHPRRFARNAVQYVRDCFLYYGTETRDRPWGETTHFKLFDAPFDDGRDRIVGQQRAQERIFRLLENFARQGSVDKLVLLHGPNGSAKSTMIETVMRGLEDYSRTDEGALYRFNWIFPGNDIGQGSSIGFEGFSTRKVEETDLDTFAYLDEEEIDATMRCHMKDHPLLLLPQEHRRELLEEHIDDLVIPGVSEVDETDAIRQNSLDGDGDVDGDHPFIVSDYILYGDISHTSRQIFDALLNAYDGAIEKVLRHVQVERIFISRRYREGAVVVEPQRAVDAGLRQLTVDKSLSALPTSLQNETLFEPFGDLVDANRGLIDYDDLFKRPKELNQYLLATSEKGTVTLENRILHLDMVLLATGNEDYLDAFKQTPDYSSFKGRMELVRVPYLLDYTVEEEIYHEQLATVEFIKPVAPHTMFVAALWGVLTRLKRPDTEEFEGEVEELVDELSPLEKADLYAKAETPDELGPDESRELESVIPDLRAQDDGSSEYEGRRGASPREMTMILLNASQNDTYPTLSPLAVFDELSDLVKDASVFPFLQQEPDGEYHRHDDFIDAVRERYLEILDREIRNAMGLVEEGQYRDLFDRYIDHVNAWLKDEKVYNPITGQREEPDEELMDRVEETVDIDQDLEEFREGLISSIAAYSIDNPEEEVEYREIFPNLFDRMSESFYEKREEQIGDIQEDLLTYFEGNEQNLSDSQLETVEETLENLREEYDYSEVYAQEAVAFLHSNRYKD